MRRFHRAFGVWILFLLAAAGFTLARKNPPSSPPVAASAVPLSPFLFEENESRLIAFSLRKDGNFASFERNRQSGWRLRLPRGKADFNAATIEAAATQLLALPRLESGLRLSPADVGIDSQARAAYVSLRFADGQESAFWVGNLTPSGRGYYLLRPNGEVDIVEKDSLDVFFRLLNFLKENGR